MIHRRKWLQLTAGACLGSIPLISSTRTTSPSVKFLSGRSMGTYWSAVVETELPEIVLYNSVNSLLSLINKSMSPFEADSELSRFNQRQSSDWISVSSHFHQVLSTSLQLSNLTKGTFDPTVGPLVNRFGFGPIQGNLAPNIGAIETKPAAVRKQIVDLTLDLCAVAKGYAVDLIVERFEQLGIENFLVDIGGDLACRGAHHSGRAWQIALEKPHINDPGIFCSLALGSESVATSSTHINGFDYRGHRTSHIINKPVGKEKTEALRSVTVIHNQTLLADGWATGLLASGFDKGLSTAVDHSVSALFIVQKGGNFRGVSTGNFAEYQIESELDR